MQPLQQILQKFQQFQYNLRESGKGIVAGGSTWGIEERPKVQYSDLVDIYEKDASAGFVVDGTVKSGLGIGYHYRHNGTPEGEEQVKILEAFNNNVKMRGRNVSIGTYLYGMGFCPVEPVSKYFMTDLNELPLRATWTLMRETRGGKIIYVKEWYNGLEQKFYPDEGDIILFTMNTNADNPLGRGVLHRVAETAPYAIQYSDGTKSRLLRPSLYRAKQMQIHDLTKLLHNMVPKSLWKLLIKDASMPDAASKIEKMEPGQRMATNAKEIDIKSELTDVKNGFSQLVTAYNDEYNMALQSFLPKFFGSAGWTEASSKTAERIWYNGLVQNLQESFAEIKIRQIDDVVLAQHGFTENYTKYYWGMPKGNELQPAILVQVMAQIVSSFQVGLIDPKYALTLFNQVIDTLGNMGIALDTKVSDADKLGEKTSEVAKALLDGDFSTDKRELAEQWLKTWDTRNGLVRHQDNIIPRKISLRV